MYKYQFISRVAKLAQLNTEQVGDALNAMKEIVKQELITAGEVRVPGLVSFNVRKRHERLGRNLASGERQTIAAGHTVKSRPAGTLSSSVINGLNSEME